MPRSEEYGPQEPGDKENLTQQIFPNFVGIDNLLNLTK